MNDRANHPKRFATMLRGMAARIDSGELTLIKSEHDLSSDPYASQHVAFTVSPVRVVEPQGAPVCECKGTLTIVNADGVFELCPVCAFAPAPRPNEPQHRPGFTVKR